MALQASSSAATYYPIATVFGQANVATWPVNCSLLASLIAQPLFARISDHVGRRIPFVTAVLVFIVANTLSVVGKSWTWYMFTRGVNGIGAGGMVGLGNVIIPWRWQVH